MQKRGRRIVADPSLRLARAGTAPTIARLPGHSHVQGKPLIELDDVLLQHCGHGTVVTANERLADALSDAYEHYRQCLGSVEAPSARVTTIAEYLRNRYAELGRSARTQRLLLNRNAERLVWLEHTPEVLDIDLVDLYPRIADAWRVMHDWELTSSLEQFDDNENHRLFRDWSRIYLSAARQRGWTTEAELPAILAMATRERRLQAEPLLLVGFDVVPTSLARLIESYRSVGADVRHHAPDPVGTADIVSVSCDNPERELRAAIHWARNVLADAREPVSICIAVQDLVESHDRVVRELDAILRPDESEPTSAISPYNISGGIALSAVPVIATAFDFLEWLFEPYYYTRVEVLLASPFLNLPATARGWRPPQRCDAAHFAALTSAPPLREIVMRASKMGLLDLEAAVSGIRGLLALAGWPNMAHLSSESFQAYRSFVLLLEEFATHADFVRPRHFSAMIRQFRLTADRRLFAPQRPKAPIQVLGYLETIGLEFTHLWVTGLSQADWPAAPSPTSFIPLRHLRAAWVPRSDADREIAFARRLMQRWSRAAESVVFSHPLARNDIPCQPSSLVGEFSPSVEQHHDEPALALSHPYLLGRSSRLLRTSGEMDVGPVRVERLRHRGTGILRDQSACPFRAFARYRLHAPQVIPPHSFPDATDRGIATHTALRRLFERLGPDVEFKRIDDETLAAAIADAVSFAVATYGALPATFRVSEQARMTALLLQWLQLERAHTSYRIVASETATTLSIGGIDFDLRIDRVDASSASGDLLVIDYKTGPISPNVVMGARPEEPQLPMYALSIPGVAAVGFACIRQNECRLVGWSAGPYSASHKAAGIRFSQPPAAVDGEWGKLLEFWRTSLTALAIEFRTGTADVRPRDANVCNECNLHALCRIREVQRVEVD